MGGGGSTLNKYAIWIAAASLLLNVVVLVVLLSISSSISGVADDVIAVRHEVQDGGLINLSKPDETLRSLVDGISR